MAALVFLAAAAPPTAAISAAEAMANYRALLRGSLDAEMSGCPGGDTPDITVCGRTRRPPPRLPMRDQLAEPGELVHHPGEPPSAATALRRDRCGPTSCAPPNRQVETLGKAFGLLKKAITGADPD